MKEHHAINRFETAVRMLPDRYQNHDRTNRLMDWLEEQTSVMDWYENASKASRIKFFQLRAERTLDINL